MAVRAARLVRQALTDLGLSGALKTSGAKGLHVFVPIDEAATVEQAAGATRAIAARAAALDPGVPVSFPVGWDDLDDIAPTDFTVHNALERLGDRDPWADQMPEPQSLAAELIEEGGALPIARVQAMHEGKRRARARRSD